MKSRDAVHKISRIEEKHVHLFELFHGHRYEATAMPYHMRTEAVTE